MKYNGLKLFAGATLVALAVYGVTLPDGTPWGIVARWPHAWLWASAAAGFVAALAARHFGTRVGLVAALGWIFFPRIWNGAILGDRFVAFAAIGAIAIWVLDVVLWIAFSDVRKVNVKADSEGRGDVATATAKDRRSRLNRIAGRCILYAALVATAIGLVFHDYRLGSAAPSFAREVARAAGDRVIVLNGVLDTQVLEAVARLHPESADTLRCLRPDSKDPDYRNSVREWARKMWPAETNLAVAAQIGVSTFLDVAIKAHPDRFYPMTGAGESYESWEARWTAFAPYLESSDRFVRVARRVFANNANAIANDMDEAASAWRLYWKILDEIDERNISAFINLSEMVRKGYAATEEERKRITDGIADFFGDAAKRRYAREDIRSAGPLKGDPELITRLVEANRKRLAAARAAGEKIELSAEAKELVAMNNDMLNAANEGNLVEAGRLARKILANPKWRSFIPANAVMGAVSAKEGDYAAAAVFFRAATSGTNQTPVSVWNDYADALMHLDKLDEAEVMIRKVIAGTDENVIVPRITLAQILERRSKGANEESRTRLSAEITALMASVLTNAPPEAARQIRSGQHHGEYPK